MAKEPTSALGAMYNAREVDGVNLMSSEAGVTMRSELEGMYTTEYILSQAQVCEIEALSGYGVRPLGKSPLPSCHWQLAVLRDMIRKAYLTQAKPITTRRRTLVVASAAREIAAYWGNPNVDFFIGGKESKDHTRIVLRLLDEVRDIFSKKVMVAPDLDEESVPKHKRRGFLILKGLDELIQMYQSAKRDGEVGVERIFTQVPDKKYEMLLVEDGHYNFSRRDWLELFKKTGAITSWVIGTMPVELLFSDMPLTSGLKITERVKPGTGGTKDLVRGVVSAIRKVLTGLDGKAWFAAVVVETVVAQVVKGVDNVERFGEALSSALRSLDRYASWVFPKGEWLARCDRAVAAAVEFVRDWDTTQLVMTFKGHSNGYVHDKSAFMTLLKYPKIQLPEYDFALSVELFQRVGVLGLVQIQLCGLNETIARTLALRDGERCVRVLDIVASFDFVNNETREPVYFTMLHREFYDTIDFLSAQKPETITPQAAMTMIRRGFNGLSLGKAVVTPAWRLSQEYLYRASLVTCLVALERRSISEMVVEEAFTKLITEEETRWAHYKKKVLHAGLALATAGLAIPIYGMYSWLMQTVAHHPLYIELDSEIDQVVDEPLWASLAGAPEVREFIIDATCVAEVSVPTIESECDFIKMLGDVGDQDPVCMHRRCQAPVVTELVYTADEVARLRADLVQSRDAVANTGLYGILDDLVNLLDKDVNGFTLRTQFERLQGPPGVGKSFTMRQFLSTLEKKGKGVGVHSPMSKLAPDYTVEHDGIGPFPFYTTHKFYRIGKVNVMVVEEYTNMDERILAYMAYKTGAELVVMIGDEGQTGLQPDEGVRPFDNAGKLQLDKVREHILPKNFRSDAYAVALLNKECGYCIYAVNDSVTVPVFHEAVDCDPERYSVMTFTRQSAHAIQQPVGQENTVRRNQGQTLAGTHLFVTDVDDKLVRNNALFAVAISRHKVGTGINVYGDTGAVIATLRDRMRVDDADFRAKVLEYARPDYRSHYAAIREKRFGPDIPLAADAGIVQVVHDIGAVNIPDAKAAKDLWWNDLCDKLIDRATKPVPPPPVPVAPAKEALRGIARFPDVRWCTWDTIASVVQVHGQKVGAFPCNEAAYVDLVVANKVTKGDVPLRVMTDYLARLGVPHLMCDTRDGSIVGDWRWDKMSAMAALAAGRMYSGCLFNYNGTHVWPMSTKQVEGLLKLHTVPVMAVDGVQVKSVKYRGYWTIGEVELYNDVTFNVSTSHRATQFLPLGAYKVLKKVVDPANTQFYFDANKVGGSYVLQLGVAAAGGIGLFGPDEVLVQKIPVTMRNDLATFMVNENDFTQGGATWLELGDRFPVQVFSEREFSWAENAYLHAEVVDPSVGTQTRTNDVGASVGPTKLLQKMTVRKDPLYIRLDRRGRHLGDFEVARAFGGGYGYTQTTSVVETLGAAERYFVKPKGSRTSVQGRRHAIEMATRHYYTGFDTDPSVFSWDMCDGIQQQQLADALRRSYDARALGLEMAGVPERQVTFTNKAQFKVCKTSSVEDKISKVGQGISATSSAINLRYGAIMRQADHAYALRGKHWNIFDCYMTEQQLVDKVRVEAALLPDVARPVTSDADEFDSVQNWHSALAEVRLNSLLVGNAPVFEQYVTEVRTDYPVSAPGLFSGVVKQAKPSGAPDTLGGNTKTSDMYTEVLIQGRGPKMMVKKGDDKSRLQYDQRINRENQALLARYSPLTLKITHGDTQFCGKVMTSEGLYENVVSIARKALAHWDKEYRTWAEYQISLRDRLASILANGVWETVVYSARAMGVSEAKAWAAYGILQSLCHISEKQWREATVVVERNFPAPRTALFGVRPWGC